MARFLFILSDLKRTATCIGIADELADCFVCGAQGAFFVQQHRTAELVYFEILPDEQSLLERMQLLKRMLPPFLWQLIMTANPRLRAMRTYRTDGRPRIKTRRAAEAGIPYLRDSISDR